MINSSTAIIHDHVAAVSKLLLSNFRPATQLVPSAAYGMPLSPEVTDVGYLNERPLSGFTGDRLNGGFWAHCRPAPKVVFPGG